MRIAPGALHWPMNRFTPKSTRSSRSGFRQGRDTRLVSIHSFTPVYKQVARPWHVGVLHDEDRRLAAPLDFRAPRR